MIVTHSTLFYASAIFVCAVVCCALTTASAAPHDAAAVRLPSLDAATTLRLQHDPMGYALLQHIHRKKQQHHQQLRRKPLPAAAFEWPATVPTLNVSAYLGNWFNVYANLAVLLTFQNNSKCATATYSPINATTVRVYNWERLQFQPNGTVRSIHGFATQLHPHTAPGQLEVRLFASNASPFPAPYWIFNVSEIDPVTGQYEWAIVSDMLKLTLFILTRDLKVWEEKYETMVLALAAERGFTGLDAPIKIEQSMKKCNYWK